MVAGKFGISGAVRTEAAGFELFRTAMFNGATAGYWSEDAVQMPAWRPQSRRRVGARGAGRKTGMRRPYREPVGDRNGSVSHAVLDNKLNRVTMEEEEEGLAKMDEDT